MIKGSVITKQSKYQRWVRLFNAWMETEHFAIVIHCISPQQVRNIQKSAVNWRARNNYTFWTHTNGTDLYMIRPEEVMKCAMEVCQDTDGLIYFYNSEKPIDNPGKWML